MRVASDDQVGPGFRGAAGEHELLFVRRGFPFRSPVQYRDAVIRFCLCLPDSFKKHFGPVAVEGAGLSLQSTLGRRIGVEEDGLGVDKGDPEAADGVYCRGRCFLQVLSGADVSDTGGFQRVQGVKQAFLAVVVGVVVPKRHQVRAHFLQDLCVLRVRPEVVLLGHGSAAGGIGELIVDYEEIRALHDGERFFVKASSGSPLCQSIPGGVAGIHQNIPREGDGEGAVRSGRFRAVSFCGIFLCSGFFCGTVSILNCICDDCDVRKCFRRCFRRGSGRSPRRRGRLGR